MPSKVYEFIMDSCVAAGLSMTNKILRTKSPAGEREESVSRTKKFMGENCTYANTQWSRKLYIIL